MSQNTGDTANDATSPVPSVDTKPEDAPAEFADEVAEDTAPEAIADGDTVSEPAKELPDPAAALAEVMALVAELTAEVESLKDEALRARAEVDNIRKRSQAEVASIRRYAVEGFAREFVNKIQNMRKDIDMVVTEKIHIVLSGDDGGTGIILKQKTYISEEVLAKTIRVVDAPLKNSSVFEFDNYKLYITLQCA